jgi:hypothetical protein
MAESDGCDLMLDSLYLISAISVEAVLNKYPNEKDKLKLFNLTEMIVAELSEKHMNMFIQNSFKNFATIEDINKIFPE